MNISKHAYHRFRSRFYPLFRNSKHVDCETLLHIVVKQSRKLQAWRNIPFIYNSLGLRPMKDDLYLFEDKKILFIVKDGMVVTSTYYHPNYNHFNLH